LQKNGQSCFSRWRRAIATSASAQVDLLRSSITMQLLRFPWPFSLIGAAKTGFWAFQLTVPRHPPWAPANFIVSGQKEQP
jgi:hypothetical protein